MTTPPPPPYPRSPSEPEATAPISPAPEPPADAPETDNVDKRRRRLILGGVVAAVVLVLVACGAGAVGLVRVADAVGDGGSGRVRMGDACRALEVRLNRVAPPGAAANPRQRAVAIRNENAAVKPFLDEISRRTDEDRPDRVAEGWSALVTARTAYADALDRQVATGAPAFFVAPVDDDGDPVVGRLEDRHWDCAATVRRLAAPDL
ncbi:hypothetical protein O7635_13650 [Asanoa sp. WMMD1127]|uniref:hypothetical protein n=1 Tax=Asanoa sp. WMMD1127 TaxID=3016107 RepID=UPI002417AB10|nr:hypothetical protein [Asanoa sp. WMMD1127]MDG4822895.1 hypothetical protein [Asanoa sp. WMMD1127]